MKDLIENKISSEAIFKGKVLDIRCDKVTLPNGKIGTREYINHPGAVCCVPILNDGRVVLINQYRYAVCSVGTAVPAGSLDKNEKPEYAAVREIEEEIGYKANNLILLNKIYPAVGFANEEMWIYLTQDLEKTSTKTDEDEFIQIMPVKFKKALKMIWSGQIRDAKSIIALLCADRFLRKES